MGSMGESLGSIMVDLTGDKQKFYFFINSLDYTMDISITLEKNGKKESFQEHERYNKGTLLAELYDEIEKK